MKEGENMSESEAGYWRSLSGGVNRGEASPEEPPARTSEVWWRAADPTVFGTPAAL
jgi:hypothetical protein